MTDDIENRAEAEKLRMSPLAWRLLILMFVITLLVFDATRPPSSESWSWVWIGKNLWKMPGGIGALVGTLFGLMGGFATLIRAQKHQAELARRARKAQVAEDRKILAAGLRGELNSVTIKIKSHMNFLRNFATFWENKAKDQNAKNMKLRVELVPAPECRFYAAKAGDLGLLGADLTYDLTFVYEKIAEWRRQVDLTEETFMVALFPTLPGHADILEQQLPLFTDAIRRLKAVERGDPDPGRDPAIFKISETDDTGQ